jgi:hypothetical protein
MFDKPKPPEPKQADDKLKAEILARLNAKGHPKEKRRGKKTR